ncbi:MAG: ACP S-malonyltransferase [Ferruginibacter sp.]
MKHAYVFPGQGAQVTGMGMQLYDSDSAAEEIFNQANEILGFRISDIMFTGTNDDLKKTNITQPAVFIHSIAAFASVKNAQPEMVAGHSLGEFSALVANNVLTFEEALKLVSIRADAMQRACEINPSVMAAVLGLEDKKVEDICENVTSETGEIVVAANYNCPGQLVISGSLKGIEIACERSKEAGAKRALVLPVGGAFHSPLMLPAKEELARAIDEIFFKPPSCPIYQNVAAKAITDPEQIKANLISQLNGPVKWTQSVLSMIADGADHFTECGPGKVLQGLILKINKEMTVNGIS